MAVKKVICKYCGVEFNKDLEPYEKVSNRYAHKACYDNKQLEIQQKRELTDYIQRLYYPYEPDWKMVTAQIKRYKDEGMTYYGMLHTLEFFFKIKGNKVDKNLGIGIIPYQYKKATAYFKNLNETYAKSLAIQENDNIDIQEKEEVIVIENPASTKKLLDFEY